MTSSLRIGACLSLTGKFARFGMQAAAGLETWASLADAAELVIEDDGSDWRAVEALLPDVARRCDLLLGPYSTILSRSAGRMAAEHGWLIWNHGGSGDDVETAHPGYVISILTPASRYAEPFVRLIAAEGKRELVIVRGAGSFGRQVSDGAMVIAQQLGIRAQCVAPDDALRRSADWDLFSAGVFEDDADLVSRAQRLDYPPRRICSVAAGVRDFASAVDDAEGVYGIAQWFPGVEVGPGTGPDERGYLREYARRTGIEPDYPAAQAAAAAALAVRCAEMAGSARRADLWNAATSLETSTLFGAFGVDPQSGAQVKHRTVLLRWLGGDLAKYHRGPARWASGDPH
ncbi:MAG TPA: ABC transporter substrate-binding protein [Streptosporangiaceae bacterium]|nr:ABC transporter substrate-binding protein [Streptosporangiaceae bacterium]